jgi:hypothetical protein
MKVIFQVGWGSDGQRCRTDGKGEDLRARSRVGSECNKRRISKNDSESPSNMHKVNSIEFINTFPEWMQKLYKSRNNKPT